MFMLLYKANNCSWESELIHNFEINTQVHSIITAADVTNPYINVVMKNGSF